MWTTRLCDLPCATVWFTLTLGLNAPNLLPEYFCPLFLQNFAPQNMLPSTSPLRKEPETTARSVPRVGFFFWLDKSFELDDSAVRTTRMSKLQPFRLCHLLHLPKALKSG